MRRWNLGAGDPLSLTIAADARFCQPDYTNDHIWELKLGKGEPASISLETTFGLRAHWMRLFPRFIHKEAILINPTNFFQPPRVQSIFPNYIALNFTPKLGIKIIAEYWVPSSQVVTGRLIISNQGDIDESFRMEWVGLLSHLGRGESMANVKVGITNALQGKTGGLAPVCFITGGPQPGSGPYPSLALDLDLSPGNSRQFTWALAALPEIEASFELARRTTALSWEKEITRLEMHNTSQSIEIITGDPEWDAAFALAQKVAFGLFFKGSAHLPHYSFVLSRQLDHGRSLQGDGTDYSYLWNGQSALDTYYLNSLILPGGLDYAEGLLLNFLSTQDESGFVDWKPGLAGQRTHRLAQPLLATIALQIAKYKPNHAWLSEIFPALYNFVNAWFKLQHDRDGDGYPEWDHPLQTGLEDSPMYAHWLTQAQGVDISILESPSLASFLYREIMSLIQIARRIQHDEQIPPLQDLAESLSQALETTWNANSKTYRYRDRKSHRSNKGILLRSFQGKNKLHFKRTFKSPQRVLIQLTFEDGNTHPLSIAIHGEDSDGELIEKIPYRGILWCDGKARCTSQNLFLKLKQVEIQGIGKREKGKISTVDYSKEDLSLLLPIWAGIPTQDRAKLIIESNLIPRYLKKYGIPVSPPTNQQKDPDWNADVHIPWNHMLGEGLLAYGYRQTSAKLVTKLMRAIIPALKQSSAFHERYNAEIGQHFGERNYLSGLAPLGLFLQTLGVEIINNHHVILQGNNPFPWPVTVKYQGISITRHAADTVLTFPSGQTVTVSGPGPHQILLE